MGNPQLKDDLEFDQTFADELEPGTQLMHGQYTIEAFLNAGGFGITYSARDSLDRKVVIKECFPGSFCRRSTALVQARSRAHQRELASIVRLFVQEARSLAKLDHPNIVGVHQVFEENSTAYMALDYVEGRDLLDMIENPIDLLEPEEVEQVLRKVLDAVGFIHDQGILHRDISPDNILMQGGRNPILIDFGAAREEASKQSRVLSAMRVVKDGYSPQEFYIAGSDQGPYSDLYALAASFYHLMTGELPPNSQARLAAVAAGEPDPYQPLVDCMPMFRTPFLEALDKALAILPKDRVGSAKEWLDLLDGVDNVVTMIGKSPAPESGSEKPRSGGRIALLAGGAVAALIAAGVLTQTDLLSGTPAGDEVAAISDNAGVTVIATPPASAPDAQAKPVLASTPEVAEPAPAAAAVETTAPAPADFAVFETPSILADPEQAGMDAALIMPAEISTAPVVAQPEAVFVASQPGGLPFVDMTLSLAPAEPRLSPHPEVIFEAPAPVVAGTPALPRLSPHPDLFTAPVEVADLEPDLAYATPFIAQPAPQIPQPSVIQAAVSSAPVIAPEIYELPGVLTGWFTVLPYDGFFTSEAGQTKIFAVNGVAVTSQRDFDITLRETMDAPQSPEVELTVNVGTTVEAARDVVWSLPVVHRTAFVNGLSFETVAQDGAWITRVVSGTVAQDIDLKPGDILTGDLSTSTVFDRRTSLPDRIADAQSKGEAFISLAINRGGALTAVALPINTK